MPLAGLCRIASLHPFWRSRTALTVRHNPDLAGLLAVCRIGSSAALRSDLNRAQIPGRRGWTAVATVRRAVSAAAHPKGRNREKEPHSGLWRGAARLKG